MAEMTSDWRPPDQESIQSLADSLLLQQGVLSHTYTTETPVTYLATWAGALGGKIWPQPKIPSMERPKWHLYHFVLLPTSLLVAFSEKGELVGMVHLERCKVEGIDPRLPENPSCRVIKLYSPQKIPTSTFDNAPCLYMLLPSEAQQKLWLANLTIAVVECEHGMDRAFSKCPPPKWLLGVDADAEGGESLEWLNLFLERYFADMFQSQTFYYRTLRVMSEKLLLIRKPAWIGSITVKELNIGSPNIVLNFLSFHSSNQPKEMIGVVDVVYKGGLRISFGAVLNIGKSVRVPVEVLVHLESLSGRLFLSVPALLHKKWDAYFREMPTVNVTVKVIVGGLDKKVEVTSLNRLHKFVQKTFLRQVELALVFPSRLRLFLPIVQRKSQLKTLRFNPEQGGYQYVVPLDPSMVKTEDKGFNHLGAVEQKKDADLNTWEVKGHLKAHLREFIVRRLYVLLNLGYLKQLSQLMSPDVRLTAGLPEAEFVGEEQVFSHYKGIYNAFEDSEVRMCAVTFSADGNIIARWCWTGTHTHMLWEIPPSSKRVSIYGLTQVTFEQDQLRIVRLKTFYRLPLLQNPIKVN
jgi:hypothetical protein